MIELQVSKSISKTGATIFTITPEHIELGGMGAHGLDKLHITLPDDWGGQL